MKKRIGAATTTPASSSGLELSPDPHGLDGRDNDGIGCES